MADLLNLRNLCEALKIKFTIKLFSAIKVWIKPIFQNNSKGLLILRLALLKIVHLDLLKSEELEKF